MSLGNVIVMATLDLQKAFDTVNHNILCKKVQATGIGNQKQIIKVSNTELKHLPITCGVSQGSILSPLLFSCHANDMTISVSFCCMQTTVLC